MTDGGEKSFPFQALKRGREERGRPDVELSESKSRGGLGSL